MIKKSLLTLVVFVLVAVCAFCMCTLLDSSISLPKAITEESPCPATSCASGSCHGFDNVPDPDGINQMTCPEAGCTSTECHGWNSLVEGEYRNASDSSMNLWILFPAAIAAGVVLLAGCSSRYSKAAKNQAPLDVPDSKEGNLK